MEIVTAATPELEDLLQEVPAMVTVPVRVEGQTLTHELPAKRAQAKTDAIPSGVWTALLPATPKRSRTVLLSSDNPFYYSTDGTGTAGMQWPNGIPLELRNAERVYVMGVTQTVTLSHLSELWAD